jgi:hypothetical protein
MLGSTVAVGGLWAALFLYQLATTFGLIVVNGSPSPPHAQLLTVRTAISLLLICGAGAAGAALWAGDLAPTDTRRTMRLLLIVLGLVAVRRQYRQWSAILALARRDRSTVLLPAAFWLAAIVVAVITFPRWWDGEIAAMTLIWVDGAWDWLLGTSFAIALAGALVLVGPLRIAERYRWISDDRRWHHPMRSALIAGVLVVLGLMFVHEVSVAIAARVGNLPASRVGMAAQIVVAGLLAVAAIRRPLWDVFLSYKSQDAMLVREVADRLLAAGVRVWFAEYYVRLSTLLFPLALYRGLLGSRWGVLFTNDRYAQARWCQREVKWLLWRRGPRHVLEIQIPREPDARRRFAHLNAVEAAETRDPRRIASLIADRAGLTLAPSANVDASEAPIWLYEARYLGRSVTLDRGGWSILQEPMDGEIGGLTFRHNRCAGLFVNVWAHRETSNAGQRATQTIDDRQMFTYLRRFARRHLRRLPHAGVRARGVHLLFHNGLSQIAVTYHMGHYWTRKVSLVIPNATTSDMAEFEFTFGFVGTFAEYCAHAATMDRLALSLSWA